MPDEETTSIEKTIIRLEAKVDVVLGRHEAKIDDLVRRQGETDSTLREHDTRITANALTIAETRAQATAVSADVQTLRTDITRDIAEVKQLVESNKPNIPAWAAVAVAALAVVITPILSALLQR